ncbi:MAG: hypothetical protein K6E84_00935 [Lachnospiraceae bacterium]|nr:hypothetical protein [Lachnospiraceae bacterium]
MKKKIVILCLGSVMAATLFACGSEGGEASASAENEVVQQEETDQESAALEEQPKMIQSEQITNDGSSVQVFGDVEQPEESYSNKEEDNTQAQEKGLPPYKSAVSGSIEEAITLYMWKEFGFDTPNEEGGVNIPAYVIVKNATDGDITKVYGNFCVYGYTLDGTNMVCTNGGSFPGVFSLRQNENGYEVAEFEMAEDGSGHMASLEKICGDDTELLDLMKKAENADDPENITARISFLRMYASVNNLDLKTYQDYGWDPVSLAEVPMKENEEQDTAGESDQAE